MRCFRVLSRQFGVFRARLERIIYILILYILFSSLLSLLFSSAQQHLENTAHALFFRTLRSKSLLERALKPLRARNHCSSLLFGASEHSKSLHKRAPSPLCARNHCSRLLSSHGASEITAQACSVATVSSKSVLKLAQ